MWILYKAFWQRSGYFHKVKYVFILYLTAPILIRNRLFSIIVIEFAIARKPSDLLFCAVRSPFFTFVPRHSKREHSRINNALQKTTKICFKTIFPEKYYCDYWCIVLKQLGRETLHLCWRNVTYKCAYIYIYISKVKV